MKNVPGSVHTPEARRRIRELRWEAARTCVERCAVVLDFPERAAAGEDSAAAAPRVGLFGRAFGARGRVGQRENSRALIEPRHGRDNFFGERAGRAGRTDQDVRLDRFDRFGK